MVKASMLQDQVKRWFCLAVLSAVAVRLNLLWQYYCSGSDGVVYIKAAISVPNVANCFMRGSFLLGRFEYSDRCTLDRTHLRFMTLATRRKLIAECICRGLDVAPTPVSICCNFTILMIYAGLNRSNSMFLSPHGE